MATLNYRSDPSPPPPHPTPHPPTIDQIHIPHPEKSDLVLESMTDRRRQAKSDKVTDRAKVFAKELYDAKLLSESGFERVSATSIK